MRKEKIVEILKENFQSVYCGTCESEGDKLDEDGISRCDDCHRKAMNWGISDDACSNLADKIIKADIDGGY